MGEELWHIANEDLLWGIEVLWAIMGEEFWGIAVEIEGL
jgi:hypothetical protein